MVDTFDQLDNVAQICRKCPTITLRRAYVRALREWCQQTQWLRTNIDGQVTTVSRQYSLGDDPYVEIIGIQAMNGSQPASQGIQFWPIVTSDSGQWDPNMNPGMPVRFQYIPEAQFSVDPYPFQTYGITITLILQPKKGAVMIPAAPLVKYSPQIEAGALSYLMSLTGQPWSNPVESLRRDKEFRSGISNGKAEVAKNFNVGAVRARQRQFIVS